MFSLALLALATDVVGSKPKWTPLNQSQRTKALPAQPPAPSPVAQADPTPAAEPQSAASPAPPPVAMAPPAPEPVPVSARLDLSCFGGGTANKATAATAWSHGYASGAVGNTWWSGSGNSTTTMVGTRQQQFGEQVDVRLFGGDDRIRMPRTMLPGIHGGEAGWFKLKNVVADARSIRASAAVNVLNNPKVFIDRVTGTISISGKSGDYAGQCQAMDVSAPAKF